MPKNRAIGSSSVNKREDIHENPGEGAECRLLLVPPKYLSRALATLTRCGLVTGTLCPPVALEFHPHRLMRRKGSAQAKRRSLSAQERNWLLNADSFRCGQCGDTFNAAELQVDHIIPVSLLGADHPGNWGALCKPCNRNKSDKFERVTLRFYRSEPVVTSVRLHFKDGFFWPTINGRIRMETR